jgi:ADP-ribose pyrophosphatase
MKTKTKRNRLTPVFKGKIIQLNQEEITLPNGRPACFEIVRHPGASAIVPLKENGNVILIRQYRYAVDDYLLEIPAGTSNPGEDPAVCAARELEEEIGYKATRWQKLLPIFTAPGFCDEKIHLYLAEGLRQTKQHLDQDEIIERVEMPLSEAVAKILDGTICDAKSISGLMRVYLRQQKK